MVGVITEPLTTWYGDNTDHRLNDIHSPASQYRRAGIKAGSKRNGGSGEIFKRGFALVNHKLYLYQNLYI